MDYVPKPLNSTRTPLVPLFTNTRYNETIAFEDYPQQQGWGTKTRREWTSLFENPTEEFQAFLQRWLLLCPLQAFGLPDRLDISDVKHSNFCEGADVEIPELTLRKLPGLAQRWLDRSYTTIEDVARLQRFMEPFSAAASIHQRLTSPDQDDARVTDEDPSQLPLQKFIFECDCASPLDPWASIAISSMLSFIWDSMQSLEAKLTGENGSKHGRLGHSEVYQWRSPIWKEMRQLGWCPSVLTPMSVRFNTAGLVFMWEIERQNSLDSSKTHTVAETYERAGDKLDKDSNFCTSFTCVHRRLSDDTYTTSHVQGCQASNCKVTARLEDMAPILDDKENTSFPLVVSIDDNDQSDHVKLVPWKKGVPFVAISHVWSDGLGNVSENAIPRCQLRRLSRYTRNILGDNAKAPLFWLDTLCVPPDTICKDNEIAKGLQSKAIMKMRDTYEKSTVTLVLDAWLWSTVSTNMTAAEKMMRIFNCTWNSRLWTYQEGALPEKLYFQFADKAEDLEEMKNRLESDMKENTALKFTLGKRLLFQYNSLRGLRHFVDRSEDLVLFILGNMAFRSTSMEEDEPLCLSTLMRLETTAKPSTEKQEATKGSHMAEFWRQVPSVPSSILLASVPTLDQQGLSWAPCSTLLVRERLSETGSLNTLPNISLPRPTSFKKGMMGGLEIRSPGLLIRCDGFRPEGTFLVRDDRGFCFQIRTMMHKEVSTEAFQEAVSVLVVTTHERVHDCVEQDAVLQPLLLMQPHDGEVMRGRKIGMALIRCMTSELDGEILTRVKNDDRLRNGIVADATTRKIHITEGRNILSEKWLVV